MQNYKTSNIRENLDDLGFSDNFLDTTFLYNYQNLETTKMPFSMWMDK